MFEVMTEGKIRFLIFKNAYIERNYLQLLSGSAHEHFLMKLIYETVYLTLTWKSLRIFL